MWLTFLEKNNYPYLIFEGLNNHIPSMINGKWYLDGSDPEVEKFEIQVSRNNNFEEFVRDDCVPELHKKLIDYVDSLEYYYNDTTLWKFIHKRQNDLYHKGNPKKWAKINKNYWRKIW